jgi:DNA-binding MarR family transcriptional regulator
MTGTRWLTSTETSMWWGMVDMWRHLDRVMEQQLTAAGMSRADFEVLAPLSQAAADGLRPKELGALIAWDTSRLAHQLRRMEKRGLVERFECEADGRGTVVILTTAASQLMELAAPGHVDVVRRNFIDLLSPAEIRTLTAVARRVRDHIAANEE